MTYPASCKKSVNDIRNTWKWHNEFTSVFHVEPASTLSLLEIPEWNLQIGFQVRIQKLHERLTIEHNGFFHRQCRSQRGREYSSCATGEKKLYFYWAAMQARAYIWVVWEGRMSITYLAVSGIREVFLKTCASHLNTRRIILSKCQPRQLDTYFFILQLTSTLYGSELSSSPGLANWIVLLFQEDMWHRPLRCEPQRLSNFRNERLSWAASCALD